MSTPTGSIPTTARTEGADMSTTETSPVGGATVPATPMYRLSGVTKTYQQKNK
jgi:hypothetical protein